MLSEKVARDCGASDVIFQVDRRRKDVEGINSSAAISKQTSPVRARVLEAVVQRLLASLSSFNPAVAVVVFRARETAESRKRFHPSRLTDFQKQLSSFREF